MSKKRIISIIMLVVLAAGIALAVYGATGLGIYDNAAAMLGGDKKTAIGREMCERFNRESMEVSNEVFEGPQSVVFREAENRMHTIKAVMAATLTGVQA